jgi:hypothetical protein
MNYFDLAQFQELEPSLKLFKPPIQESYYLILATHSARPENRSNSKSREEETIRRGTP